MKRISITLFFLVLFFLLLPPFVSAHFSKTDGRITAVFHVDPNDDPIPGEQANLYFLLKDTDKKFQLTRCNCIVTVREEGKELLRQQLTEKNGNGPSIWGTDIPFIFPDRNVYQVTLTGNPVSQDAFQSFIFTWYFRVDENTVLGASTKEHFSDTDPSFLYYVIGFLSIPFLCGIGLFVLFKKAHSEEHTTKKGGGK